MRAPRQRWRGLPTTWRLVADVLADGATWTTVALADEVGRSLTTTYHALRVLERRGGARRAGMEPRVGRGGSVAGHVLWSAA